MLHRHSCIAPAAFVRWLPALLITLGCSGGGDKPGTTEPPPSGNPVATVSVSPSTGTVAVGSTTTLAATLRNASNAVLTGRSVSWSSSNTAIATVANGVVTGVAAGGPVTITATSEAKSGSAQITVTNASTSAPVATVAVSPPTGTVVVGASTTLTASLADAQGNALAGRTITWSSDLPAVATVANGIVTGVAAGGPVTITATSEGKSGTAQITVSAPGPAPVATVVVTPSTGNVQVGNTTSLTATLRDAGNNVLTGRTITWTSSNAAIATVANGVVTGVAPGGPVTITATSEGQNGAAQVTVTGVPVASVTLTPAAPDVALGFTAALTATLRDAGNNVLTGRTITWTSSSGLATVNSNGVVTGVTLGGPVTITAASEGQSAMVQLTVVQPPAVGPVRGLATAPSTTCAIGSGGAAWCWGANSSGQLGIGTVSTRELSPVLVTGGHSFVDIATAGAAFCGLTTSGAAWCWGSNLSGVLGNGSADPVSASPVPVSGSHTFIRLLESNGSVFAMCGIKANGETWCWGSNGGRFGFGNEDLDNRSVPVRTAIGLDVVQVAAADGGVCWLARDGTIYCSGGGTGSGMLGSGSQPLQSVLVPTASGSGKRFTSLSVGVYENVCGLRSAGEVWCWGSRPNGGTGGVHVPQQVSGIGLAKQVAPSQTHHCALSVAGATWCWGIGEYLGDGIGTTSVETPVMVSGGHAFTEISVSASHTCGRVVSGQIYCWGRNTSGQLGDGTLTNRLVPVLAASVP